MRRRIVLMACLCAVTGIAIAASPRARRSTIPKQRTQPVLVAGQPIPKGVIPGDQGPLRLMAAPDGVQSVWAVNVLSSLNLDAQNQQLYQSMATVLSGVTAIPNTRATFWSAVDNPPGSVINSWYGSVSSVALDGNGGYLVNVSAVPVLVTQAGGPIAMTSYSEQWDVDANNNATFIQSFDPDGESGTMPSMVAQ